MSSKDNLKSNSQFKNYPINKHKKKQIIIILLKQYIKMKVISLIILVTLAFA